MILVCACQISALTDHGWDEFGPTNETLHAIYRTLPFYQESIVSTVTVLRFILFFSDHFEFFGFYFRPTFVSER